MKYVIHAAMAGLLATTPFHALMAQESKEPPPVASDPCQVKPDENPDSKVKSNPDYLSRCKGVLKPPSGMDEQIEKHPPQQGQTPVIRPEELPSQQKPQ